MARFLHLADIHLGFDRYDSRDRTRDFYYALRDVIERHAIAAQVDFVVIAGDLFEHRLVQPAILNQAQLCLQRLKEAGIPVLAIEGNHDNRPYGTQTSWLKYLSQWQLLTLLEPTVESGGEVTYRPWDTESRSGGYVDLPCGVRVLGSQWYGATAPQAIARLATAIQALPPGPAHTVLLFHHGLEGQIARYSGALRYQDLLPLKHAGVDYLALGHIHKAYAVEDWIFNPGSIEANNVEEGAYDRGAYLVEFTATGIHAELRQDYQQRPIVRLGYTVTSEQSEDEVIAAAIATLEAAIQQGKLHPHTQPIVELRLEGQVGFERLSLDTRQLQQQLQALSNALIFLLRYDVEDVMYNSPVADDASRQAIEHSTFLDVLTGHRDYKKRAAELAQGLIDLKDRSLAHQDDRDLYAFVDNLLNGTASLTADDA